MIKSASMVRQVVATRIPTRWGIFQALGFEREIATRRRIDTALALTLGDVARGAPLLRIHSQCFTGEVLGSLRCDCQGQLELAMREISHEGHGLVVYEYQEGRGIGLMAKLQAYALQDIGFDTVDANRALGFEDDCRDFSLPATIVHGLGIRRVRLLSNNPQKASALSIAGVDVVARIPCQVEPSFWSLSYLRAKKERMGHRIALERSIAPHPRAQDDRSFAKRPPLTSKEEA